MILSGGFFGSNPASLIGSTVIFPSLPISSKITPPGPKTSVTPSGLTMVGEPLKVGPVTMFCGIGFGLEISLFGFPLLPLNNGNLNSSGALTSVGLIGSAGVLFLTIGSPSPRGGNTF